MKLLPCPFCGKQPRLWQNEADGPGGPFPTDYTISCCAELIGPDKETAAKRWNQRTVKETSVHQAAAGYVDQIDRWMTMLRYFCKAKLGTDKDWETLESLMRVLHIGHVRNVEPDKIWEIIEFNQKGKENV